MGATEKPETGDKVSWNWGGGAPAGTVAETKDQGAIEIKSKRGNTIKKKADPDNPAVRIERSGNDVVKRSSELTVEEKKNKGNKVDKKRKAKDQDTSEDEEVEDDEGKEEPHTKNQQGREVKKGGKKANKKQRAEQEEQSGDSLTEDDNETKKSSDRSGEEDGEEDEAATDEADGDENADDDQDEDCEVSGKGGEHEAVKNNSNTNRAGDKSRSKVKNNVSGKAQDGDNVSNRTRSQAEGGDHSDAS
ncbi:hypothetical protein GGS26DRAFT_506360 [Hypomontagnella submonticulosa]|nr:hypothetical protein GGS26DRAFT_506360 [Hypomontagnella submonticulosa]